MSNSYYLHGIEPLLAPNSTQTLLNLNGEIIFKYFSGEREVLLYCLIACRADRWSDSFQNGPFSDRRLQVMSTMNEFIKSSHRAISYKKFNGDLKVSFLLFVHRVFLNWVVT